MTGPNRGKIPSEMGWLIDLLDGYGERLSTLEAPDGNQIAQTVKKLSALIDNIQEQLDAYNAGRYTNEQIDNLVDAKVAAAIAAVLAGTVTVGALTVNGAATVGGSITVDGTVTLPGARATSVATAPSRVTAWIAGDGRLGHTS